MAAKANDRVESKQLESKAGTQAFNHNMNDHKAIAASSLRNAQQTVDQHFDRDNPMVIADASKAKAQSKPESAKPADAKSPKPPSKPDVNSKQPIRSDTPSHKLTEEELLKALTTEKP